MKNRAITACRIPSASSDREFSDLATHTLDKLQFPSPDNMLSVGSLLSQASAQTWANVGPLAHMREIGWVPLGLLL